MVDKDVTEAGFTMVELAVALSVIAIGIVALVGVMNSTFAVAVGNGARARAVALATREVEAIRAVPYADIPVAASSTTWTEASGGTTYTLERGITWVGEPGHTQAYKQGTVKVSWTDPGGLHDVHQSTFYYPGGLGPVATPTTTTPCGSAPAPPSTLSAAPVLLPDSGGVALVWTPGAGTVTVASWMVQSSTNNFLTSQSITDSQPGSTLALQVEGLATNTTYQFRVRAIGSCSTPSAWSPLATVTTLPAPVPACELGTANVTPAKIKLASNGASAALSESPTITVNATGTCSSLSASYKKTSASAASTAMLIASGGGVRSATLNTDGPWDVGVHSVDVYDATNVKRGTVLLTVCSKTAPTC